MENKCRTCQHWCWPDADKNQHWGAIDLAMPQNPAMPDENWERLDTLEKQRELYGYATKYCRSPKLKFYERPGKDGACVADGSEYMAVLITGEGFGCVNWEAATNQLKTE